MNDNRFGKTRDLVRTIREIKEPSHAKMDMIKDKNVRDLTNTEEGKNRWREYAAYKKELDVIDKPG
ncbi:hypothetical protein M514_19020 [Trichuris suis]|uniref:Uncharacterized protein n=1 Tax=Trichuris suis TaxID=68888 RepID=A0A085NH33_9BILA|nr:hypothetical protein M514_19020 [Trichuris suis]